MGCAVAAALVAIDALVVEPHLVLTVSRVELPAGKGGRLARALGGARIVHLSDLHLRGWGIRERRLSSWLSAEAPDLLLMTGDYGDGPEGLAALKRLLGAVRPRLGAYAVPGNNDYFRGGSEEILRTLEEAGVVVLVNRSVSIEADGGPVVIAGVDDPHYGRDDVAAAMMEAEADVPVILLAHSPDLLARRSRALMMNAGDAEGPWGRGWWWQDGAHVRPDPGEVIFPSSGRRRLRVQRREDGVAVDEVRLVPEQGPAPGPRGRRGMPAPDRAPEEIVIRTSQVRDADLHGGWRRRESDGALVDTPDQGGNQTFAEVDPPSFFEVEFEAQADVRYHVWVHLESANGRGTSDSLYVQFTDSLGAGGEPDYRIGTAVAGVDTGRVDLMLAGHTHGGQVRLPWLGQAGRGVWSGRYEHGLYDVDGMSLYVSRGVGWSYLPVRFLCPPEVVLFETASAVH
ncbi:MAG TPA: metallophosphoesterase [Candidatus Polarisedimenticolia bacterium]